MVTFVTAFIGRLHIPSGQLIYCNAAHMPLLVRGVDGSVRSIKPTPNIPLGYDEKFKFVEQGCLLGKDELLVLYTDGVTEARDVTRQMMGEEQWMDIVAHHADLLEAVKRYIGEAEPADDITLMTISKKSEVQPVSQLVPNRLDQWPLLRRTLHDYGVCLGIEIHTLKKLEIALEEAVVNVMSYSHATKIEMQITNSEFGIRNSELRIVLTDDGVPFDPTKTDSDPSRPFEEREIGGCGISMLQQMVDELHYQRTSEKNQLTIVKTY
jgi:sigma-B regulation protein RsbU (phosphoserine phosphatase)